MSAQRYPALPQASRACESGPESDNQVHSRIEKERSDLSACPCDPVGMVGGLQQLTIAGRIAVRPQVEPDRVQTLARRAIRRAAAPSPLPGSSHPPVARCTARRRRHRAGSRPPRGHRSARPPRARTARTTPTRSPPGVPVRDATASARARRGADGCRRSCGHNRRPATRTSEIGTPQNTAWVAIRRSSSRSRSSGCRHHADHTSQQDVSPTGRRPAHDPEERHDACRNGSTSRRSRTRRRPAASLSPDVTSPFVTKPTRRACPRILASSSTRRRDRRPRCRGPRSRSLANAIARR